MKQKKRKEIPAEYKWDLSLIYKNKEEWKRDFDSVKEELKEMPSDTTLTKDAKLLFSYLEQSTSIIRKIEKLYTYAHLLSDEDTGNTENQKLFGQIVNLYEEFQLKTSFFQPTILKQKYSEIENMYKVEPKLLDYEYMLKKIFRLKKHTLSTKEEKIIDSLSKSLDSSSEIFEKLTDADMKFGDIIDEKEERYEFTQSNYSKFIKSKNGRVRKDAFDLLYDTYSNFKNTIAATYYNEVETSCKIAKIYKHKNALEASLFKDNISSKVYNNLIKTVNNNLSSLHKYYGLKKKSLGLKEFHMYDTYVELVENNSKEYSFEQGKELVKNALSILGEDYVETLNKAFSEKWIDVYNNEGKKGGAYSGGGYDTKPYILLNYENQLDDVSTLAHELGHSMHSYFSIKHNPYQYAGYTIFVAEIASTVNELLLNKYMLKISTDKEEKLSILNKQLELYKGTIFRQTMFAEFEKYMHEKVEQGEILTHDYISKYYYELVKKYFGKDVIIDEKIKYEWMRIPHFYYNFYVYKYATGLSIATFIANEIYNKNEDMLKKYKNFLTLGGSMYPLEEIKTMGIDMNSSKVIESAIKEFKNTLNEFEKLLNS